MIDRSLSLRATGRVDIKELEEFVTEAKKIGCREISWNADTLNSFHPLERDSLTLTASPDNG